ncbi:MAG: hypothetical protein HFH61_00760 [Lachnospiraceae bacterium]|nr:hypothetical protein [Lachnospiraceae bacterium]
MYDIAKAASVKSFAITHEQLSRRLKGRRKLAAIHHKGEKILEPKSRKFFSAKHKKSLHKASTCVNINIGSRKGHQK